VNPFGFLCLPIFLQKLKSSVCMLECEYRPSWARGHPMLTPSPGIHSIQTEEPGSEHFLPFSKAMKADAYANTEKQA